MDQFLNQIKENKYEVTTTNLRMGNGKTLETCIKAIQHHDLLLSCHRVQEHCFIKIRCLNLEEDVSGPSKTSTYIEPEVWQGYQQNSAGLSSKLEKRSFRSMLESKSHPMGQGKLEKQEGPSSKS